MILNGMQIPIEQISRGHEAYVMIGLKNTGARPAYDLTVHVLVIPVSNLGHTTTEGSFGADELAEGSSINGKVGSFDHTYKREPQYIVVLAQYIDRTSGKSHRQTFFRSWDGYWTQVTGLVTRDQRLIIEEAVRLRLRN
jgi:hypothetical protein